MRRLATAIVLLAACGPPAPPVPAPGRDGLYRQMRACLAQATPAPPCTLVDRARGFVIIKDDDPAKPYAWLIVPDIEVTGIEDSRALVPPVVEFWRYGWAAGRDLLAKRPPARVGLAINSKAGRSQDLLHIHISCVEPAVAKALAAARIGPDWAARPFVTLAGEPYNVRRVASLDRSPFLLLRELPGARDDMAGQSLAVVGAPGGGFFAAAESAPQAESEDLLDEDCH